MDETPEFQLGQRVEIGGRTMLRPGFSLVGLTGVIFMTLPNTPAGCATVAIDWPEHGYTPANGYPEGTLPAFVNVPVNHLAPVETPGSTPLFSLAAMLSGMTDEEDDEAEPTADEPVAKPGPALQILGGGSPRAASPAPQAKEEPVDELEPAPEPEPTEPPSGRPRLRMI